MGSSLDHLGRLGNHGSLVSFSANGWVSVEEDGSTVLIVRSLQEGRWQEVVVRLEGTASKWCMWQAVTEVLRRGRQVSGVSGGEDGE